MTLNPTGVQMITIPELMAQALGSFLTADTKSRFGSSHARLAEVVPFAARLTLDCIGNSDALYHNIEHSMLVTLAGHDILMGHQMLRATTAKDYANFILACLAHPHASVRLLRLHRKQRSLVVGALAASCCAIITPE